MKNRRGAKKPLPPTEDRVKRPGLINHNVAVQLDELPFHLKIVEEMCNYRCENLISKNGTRFWLKLGASLRLEIFIETECKVCCYTI